MARLPAKGNLAEERKGRKLFWALMLNDLVEERPISQVLNAYTVNRDSPVTRKMLADAQEQSALFAAKVSHFAENVGYADLHLLISDLISRIALGARADILPLCELPYVQVVRARALHRQGYKTLESVAGAKPQEIARILDLKPEK